MKNIQRITMTQMIYQIELAGGSHSLSHSLTLSDFFSCLLSRLLHLILTAEKQQSREKRTLKKTISATLHKTHFFQLGFVNLFEFRAMQPLRKTKSVFGWETRIKREKIVRNEIIANVNKVGFTVTMTTRQPAAPLVILIFQTAAQRVKSHCKLHCSQLNTNKTSAHTLSYLFI